MTISNFPIAPWITTTTKNLNQRLDLYATTHPKTARLLNIPVTLIHIALQTVRAAALCVEMVVRGAIVLLASCFSKTYTFDKAAALIAVGVLSYLTLNKLALLLQTIALLSRSFYNPHNRYVYTDTTDELSKVAHVYINKGLLGVESYLLPKVQQAMLSYYPPSLPIQSTAFALDPIQSSPAPQRPWEAPNMEHLKTFVLFVRTFQGLQQQEKLKSHIDQLASKNDFKAVSLKNVEEEVAFFVKTMARAFGVYSRSLGEITQEFQKTPQTDAAILAACDQELQKTPPKADVVLSAGDAPD